MKLCQLSNQLILPKIHEWCASVSFNVTLYYIRFYHLYDCWTSCRLRLHFITMENNVCLKINIKGIGLSNQMSLWAFLLIFTSKKEIMNKNWYFIPCVKIKLYEIICYRKNYLLWSLFKYMLLNSESYQVRQSHA